MHQALQDHTPASLLDAIRQGEGASIEFKSSFQKEVIETVQAWINQCKQITSPRVIPGIELVQIEGKTVALVSIGEYPIKPVACKGRYFKRVGNANHQLTATEISDANIKLIAPIKVFDDRIEFFNPGVLLDDLTVEKIKTGHYKSHLRNKQVATIFKELELIEKYGSGVRRVIDSFVAYGLPEPEFQATQGGMAVTVFSAVSGGVNGGVNGGVSGGVNTEPVPLLQLIQAQPGLKTTELVAQTGKSQRTIERWLKQLKDRQQIEFRGAPKTGGYFCIKT